MKVKHPSNQLEQCEKIFPLSNILYSGQQKGEKAKLT